MFFSAKYLDCEAHRLNAANERIMVSAFGTNKFADPCKNIFSRCA